MTPQQRDLIIAAAESGDDARAVTIALQVAAANAREGRAEVALAIRAQVDHGMSVASARIEYRRARLQAAAAFLSRGDDIASALSDADDLLSTNETRPIPGDTP